MGNVMAYSGITTKVRAMSAKLLAAEDYDTIAGLGTVTEAIEYLKDKTAYAPYVNRMDISLYHREMWRRSCISLCSMIIRDSSVLPE